MTQHRLLPILAPLALLTAACQPSSADRDSSPAAPAPTTAKPIERAAPVAVSPELSVHNVVYRCTDGRIVTVRYDSERAFIGVEGGNVTLNVHPSASGVRYVGPGVQWWTRGMEHGQLSPLTEGETYAEPDSGVACTATPPTAPATAPDAAASPA